TPFKVNVEFVILIIHTMNLLWIIVNEYRSSRNQVQFNSKHMVTAILMLIVSEFAFTQYLSIHDLINSVGHVFKIIGFIYIFRAIFHENIHQPIIRLMHSEQQ